MINKVEDFGRNAGKVWKTIDSHGKITEKTLKKKTRLREDEFYAAIGWLARENKIYYDGTNYGLGDTNLTEKIGENAGKLWNMLYSCGNIDVTYIPRLTDIPKEDMYVAIGWLAKEGKIKSKKVMPKKPQLHVGLKE